MQGIFPLQYFNSPTVQVHTNGSHQNGKRGSHVSTVSIYRHGDPDGDTAMGGEWTLELQTKVREDFTVTAFSWMKAPTSTFTLMKLTDGWL